LLAELSRVDDQHRALQKAQERLLNEQKILASLDRGEAAARRREKELLEEQKKLADVEPQFRQTVIDLQDAHRRQQDVSRQISQAEQERGRLRQILQTCANQRTERAAKVTERDLARKQENAYKQLAGAFGKRGVQADIIENALPELQNYTNELLDRLTDGDMSVHIDTQRQSKTKNAPLIETLEIQISDSLGTRPMEMYSGGEAFRVSFALRIALSKLLARRAGADLQTLIVDEGFGTQDAKGREKLIDAVTAIQSDFEKILVITHIDELKDAFPSRIEVVKTPSGSQLSVMHGDSIG
jgi:exonuclease SbcC